MSGSSSPMSPLIPEDQTPPNTPIAWMVHNRVTANLLMLVLIIGGVFMSGKVKQEVFPEFRLNMITVSVSYPGASPEEIERGVVVAIEDAIQGIEGIDRIHSDSDENRGVVNAELETGADVQRAYQDIQQAIDRIRTFPDEIEEPRVRIASRRREVIDVLIYGDIDRAVLREIGEEARDQLLAHSGVTQADLEGVRDLEIHVEITQQNLRRYNLTLGEVARRINTLNVELPGGGVKTDGGELLLRVTERRDWADQFAQLPIITTDEGTIVSLSDIADVKEGFEDTYFYPYYNGVPCIEIEVYRIGNQTPNSVSEAVREVLPEIEAGLPPGVQVMTKRDRSIMYNQRLSLLLRNACIGLVLVLLILGVFLEFRLAFWVTVGIPTSFLGAMLLIPAFGSTFNMISMFAFLIALGIVVDDAIVAGENIYEYRQRGFSPMEASIRGAKDVAVPIAFSILTNIAAFLPLAFIPGPLGQIWAVIPIVVGSVFLMSWVEALFILPVHLCNERTKPSNRFFAFIQGRQQAFTDLFGRFTQGVVRPVIGMCVEHRYITFSSSIAVLLLVVSFAVSGRMGMILMPKVDADYSTAIAKMPFGTPLEDLERVQRELIATSETVIAENGGDKLATGIYSRVVRSTVYVYTYLTDPDIRPISTSEFTKHWRKNTGSIAGTEYVTFEADRGGPGRGPSITVELSHDDIRILEQAGVELAERLNEYATTGDIDDGFSQGKPQLDFVLNDNGHALGLTPRDVARQIRHAFYGAEALRQQRGRHEVKVLVRRPESQRTSEFDIESLLIRTPGGRFVPLTDIATVKRGYAFTEIERRNSRRIIEVTCDVTPMSDTNRVLASLKQDVLPGLVHQFPGLTFAFEGRQADLKDSFNSLMRNLVLAVIVIYIMLAIPFKSYLQPLIVMTAIPFGIVGAIIGHKIMDYNLSMISLQGIVALSGVVVNDALVMIDYANKLRKQGLTAKQAVHQAGVRRFRPILLTTLTTFGGLAPMIFETSRQARFMIPMAISLGFGIIVATAITLVIVPSVYLILEDFIHMWRVVFTAKLRGTEDPQLECKV